MSEAKTEEEYRQSVVFHALYELNEYNPVRISDYWEACGLPRNTPQHWCGVFALWALKEAGLAQGVNWEVGWGFIGPLKLPLTKDPKPGDIAYTHDPYQHHAIVESRKHGVLITIDGNQGQPGIKRKARPEPDGIRYYSIQPLLDEVIMPDTDPAPTLLEGTDEQRP